MGNEFYVPGDQRAAKVNDLFATVAHRYDLINDIQSFGLHRLWKRKLIRLASVRPGDHVLDLCCGTGDVAFSLIRQGAIVAGLDFSGPMLAVAVTRRDRAAPGTPKSTGRAPAGRTSGLRTQTFITFLQGDERLSSEA